MHKKLNIIDIFSGCGGLSSGFEQTNCFTTVCAIDIWQQALNTIKLNKPQVNTICSSLATITDAEILQLKYQQNIDVVVGGPPCQGFSLAGKRQVNDPRNDLWRHYVRFISIIKPEWFVLENVFGLMSMQTQQGEKVIDLILAEFKKIGYSCQVNLVSAKDFNVAQDRKRLFIIGNRFGCLLKLKPTTANKPKTVRMAIGDLETLESGQKSATDPYHFAMQHNPNHIKWLKPVPEGETAHNYKHLTGMKVKGYSTTYKRIWWDRPSPAITTCFNSISSQNNVHPSSTRALTIREAMRIQSFPDNFVFAGNHKDIRTQIGNAVPPELARQVAEQILEYTKNDLFNYE